MAKMFNINDFKKLRSRLEQFDSKREEVIKKSRDVIKLSKLIINLVHRCELKKAEPLVDKITTGVLALRKVALKNPKLIYAGSFKVAEQEFVEAVCFFNVIKNKKLAKISELNVEDEHYILGICDLSGELTRKAINSVINEKYGDAKEIYDLVLEIYEELSKFEFLSGETRKKYDAIKYDLKRLDDLMLELKLKDKI